MKTIPIYPTPKLSAPSKMPCASFSIPAQSCKTGAELVKVKGSVCEGCYALKGRYLFTNVKTHRAHNLETTLNLDQWRFDMIRLIKASDSSGYFRWFDSGDVQSAGMLSAIIDIAEALPSIVFWMPTKEKGILARNKREVPSNLVIRLSMAMIDQAPSATRGVLTSTVRSTKGEVHGTECGAPSNEGKCGTCRACWDKTIQNITYLKH